MKFKKITKILSQIFIISLSFFLIYVFLQLAILNNSQNNDKAYNETEYNERTDILTDGIDLDDKNDVHLQYARLNGLRKTYKTDKAFKSDLDSLLQNDELVYVSDKKTYVVEKLTHSHPYLRKEARNLLNEIGTRFNKKQIEKGLKPHRIVATSLLRTERSQSFLRRFNINATKETTAHLYGTTFDISSVTFIKKSFSGEMDYCFHKDYEDLLEEVMKELRSEGRCVVVREFQQTCYHITVVE